MRSWRVPEDVVQVTDAIWEIPSTYKASMRVPARIYATEKLLQEMDQGVFDQARAETLPGGLGRRDSGTTGRLPRE